MKVLWILPLLVHSLEDGVTTTRKNSDTIGVGDNLLDCAGGQLHHRMKVKKDGNEGGAKIKTRNAETAAVIDGRRGIEGIASEVAKGGIIPP